HGARADLAVHLGARHALHGGVVQGALALVPVQVRVVDEVPGLAQLLAFVPGPAVATALRLEPPLDATVVDIDGGAGAVIGVARAGRGRSGEHTSDLQSRFDLVCRL